MSIVKVFDGKLNSSSINLSNRFSDGIAYFITNDDTFELSIDCYLQLYLDVNNTEIVRAKYLQIINTETIFTIPQEYLDTGIEMSLLFIPNDGENSSIEAYVIGKDISLKTIDNKLDIILANLNTETPSEPPTIQEQQFFFIN